MAKSKKQPAASDDGVKGSAATEEGALGSAVAESTAGEVTKASPRAASKGTGRAKKPGKAAAPAATAKAPPPPAAPAIDTSLAASTAAQMVVGRNRLVGGAPTSTGKPQSATFAKFKQGVNNPTAGLDSVFGGTSDAKKSNTSFGGPNQSFRNQTQGGFNKTGVPRRTGGG